MLPLPTVDEDRGPEEDSDEDHLDGMLHARPRAPASIPGDVQPLANAIWVPGVVPEDMGQRTWDKQQGSGHGGNNTATIPGGSDMGHREVATPLPPREGVYTPGEECFLHSISHHWRR